MIGQRSLHEALLNKDTLVSINTERTTTAPDSGW